MGTSGLLEVLQGNIGPHVGIEAGNSGSSVVTEILRFLRVSTGSQSSPRVEAWNSAFLSSFLKGLRPRLSEFRSGIWALYRGAT